MNFRCMVRASSAPGNMAQEFVSSNTQNNPGMFKRYAVLLSMPQAFFLRGTGLHANKHIIGLLSRCFLYPSICDGITESNGNPPFARYQGLGD